MTAVRQRVRGVSSSGVNANRSIRAITSGAMVASGRMSAAEHADPAALLGGGRDRGIQTIDAEYAPCGCGISGKPTRGGISWNAARKPTKRTEAKQGVASCVRFEWGGNDAIEPDRGSDAIMGGCSGMARHVRRGAGCAGRLRSPAASCVLAQRSATIDGRLAMDRQAARWKWAGNPWDARVGRGRG